MSDDVPVDQQNCSMKPDDEICEKVAADETEQGKYARKRNHLEILALPY